MANNIYSAVLANSNGETVNLKLTEANQSIDNNQTILTYEIVFSVNNAGDYYEYRNGNKLQLVLGGTTLIDTNNIGAIILPSVGSQVIATGSIPFTHNADGTLTIGVYCRFQQTQKTNCVALIDTTHTFTQIPRATAPVLSANSYPLESDVTISLPRASTSFTHTLRYVFGGLSGTIASGVGESASWKLDASLASQIPNANSGVGTITCDTYSGNTFIGSKSIQITLTVPDTTTFLPIISSVTTEEAGNVPSSWGIYVQNKSKVKVDTTAYGQYGATIKSYSVTLLDTAYSGETIVSGYLSSSGNVDIKVKVVDSRNKSAEYTTTISVQSYQPPSISAFVAERCNPSGVVDGEGEQVLLLMAFSVTNISEKNTAYYTVEYKLDSETYWSTLLSGSSYSYNDEVVTSAVFDATKIYQVRLTVSDSLGNPSISVQTISTAVIVMHIRGDGLGVSFGEYSQGEGVSFNMNIEPKKAIIPPIIPAGADLDEYMTPNIYSGLDARTAGYLNSPFTDRSFSLEVLTANPEDTSIIQRATGCLKGDPATYERIYYGENWGAWLKRVAFNAETHPTFEGTDLNYFLADGQYTIGDVGAYTNCPSGCSYGTLFVQNCGVYSKQTWTNRDDGKTWVRGYVRGTWYDWQLFVPLPKTVEFASYCYWFDNGNTIVFTTVPFPFADKYNISINLIGLAYVDDCVFDNTRFQILDVNHGGFMAISTDGDVRSWMTNRPGGKIATIKVTATLK